MARGRIDGAEVSTVRGQVLAMHVSPSAGVICGARAQQQRRHRTAVRND